MSDKDPDGMQRCDSRASQLQAAALALLRQGEHLRAAEAGEEALQLLEREEGPDSPQVARALNALSRIHVELESHVRAAAMANRAVKIMDRLARRATLLDRELARTRVQALAALASALRLQTRYRAAEPVHERWVSLAREDLGPGDPEHAAALNSLALLYRFQGRLDEAEPLYRQAAEILERALGSDHPDVASVRDNLASLLVARAS